MYFGMQMNVFEELCREVSAKVMHPSPSGSVSEVFIKKKSRIIFAGKFKLILDRLSTF